MRRTTQMAHRNSFCAGSGPCYKAIADHAFSMKEIAMAEPLPLPENLPPFARDVLELFARQLSNLKFPGVDRGVLEAHAAELAEAQAEVERVEAELEQARSEAAVRALTLT